MMLTDAQLHVWEANRPDRPWDRQHRPQLDEPFTVEKAVALLDEQGVDRAVLVPLWSAASTTTRRTPTPWKPLPLPRSASR